MLSEFTKQKLDETFNNWFDYHYKYCFGQPLRVSNCIYLEIVKHPLFNDNEKMYMKNKLKKFYGYINGLYEDGVGEFNECNRIV